MIEFDYKLDYKQLDFTDKKVRKLYRIGRGEQGVLLVNTQTTYVNIGDLKHLKSSIITKIFDMYLDYRIQKTLLVWICVESFRKWVLQGEDIRNHKDGNKYDSNGKVKQEKDWATSEKAKSHRRFKEFRI